MPFSPVSPLGVRCFRLGRSSPRIQRRCDEDLMRAVAHTQEVSRVFTVMLPAGAAGNATAALCTELLSALTSSILALPEIAAAACDGLELFLAGAISNCERLATRDRLREADSDAANAYATAVKRTNAFKEILNIRMEDIVSNAKQGKYDQLLDRSEVSLVPPKKKDGGSTSPFRTDPEHHPSHKSFTLFKPDLLLQPSFSHCENKMQKEDLSQELDQHLCMLHVPFTLPD